MNTVLKHVIDGKYAEIEQLKAQIGRLEKLLHLKMPTLHTAGSYNSYTHKMPEVWLFPVAAESAVEVARVAMRALGVKKVKKTFDATDGTMLIAGNGPDTRLEVKCSRPSRCRVRQVVEEVPVAEQVIPAHTETKVRYVIENPEECGAAGEVESTEEEVE